MSTESGPLPMSQPPAPFAFCSSAICARAASTSSALVLACPARPHPPSIASVRRTQVLAVNEKSPAAAATRSVNWRTTSSCLSRLSAPALVSGPVVELHMHRAFETDPDVPIQARVGANDRPDVVAPTPPWIRGEAPDLALIER